jgi:hypothetical protein
MLYFLGGIGEFLGLGERSKNQQREFGRREEEINSQLFELFRTQSGQGPSLAQEALRQATGRAASNAQAVAASARPGNQGLAARMAAQTQGKLGSEIAGQSSLLALEEQMKARQLLTDFIARLKNADVTAGTGIAPGAGEELLGGLAGLSGLIRGPGSK